MLQVYCVGWENDRETKATLHNSAACLAMSFPPSAACKFLDLPPVNLRNLHLHLTKNPFVSQPPHLCGVTLTIKLPIKSKKHGCAARRGGGGERKAPSSPPQRRNPLQHQRHYRTIRRQRWRCLFCHLLLAEISIPVNLRFLQSHLTKNAFAIAPTHLCGIAQNSSLEKKINQNITPQT